MKLFMQLSRRHLLRHAIVTGAMLVGGSQAWAENALTDRQPSNWSSRLISSADPNNKQRTAPVITAAKLHPSGTMFITAGDDHQLRVWDIASGRVLQVLGGHADWVRALAITTDGTLLASAGNDGRVLLWDTNAWQSRELVRLPHAVATLDFHPDGSQLAIAGWSNQVRVLDVATSKPVHQLVGPESTGERGDLRTIAFSPDGKMLAVAGRTGKVRIWNMNDQTVLTDVPAHSQCVRSLLFSSDSSAILSAGEDGLVRLSPISQGFASFALPRVPGRIMTMALSGENQLAVAGSDNHIYLWNLKTRERIGVLGQHSGTITTLDCSGDTLISAGYDTTIRLWTLSGAVAESNSPKNRVSARPSFRLE